MAGILLKGEAHTPLSESDAAVKVQKVFRSHRARRELADASMATKDIWWQTIYHAQLDHSTIGFFDSPEPESAVSRWNRVSSHASKVGKGLSRDSSAMKLFFQHWIEAIDPKHRYGMSLYEYYNFWVNQNSKQPFFYWLDLGDGKDVDLQACPRSKLREQCVKYLSPNERLLYEYVAEDGKLIHKLTGELMDTKKGKWIFVMSTSKRLYSAEKIKGKFHHSSFLAGGATLAAGTMQVEDGIPTIISPHSGHYRPLEDHYDAFLTFLKDGCINLNNCDVKKFDHGYQSIGSESMGGTTRNPPSHEVSINEKKNITMVTSEAINNNQLGDTIVNTSISHVAAT